MTTPTVTHQARRITLAMMLDALTLCGEVHLRSVDVPGGERWHLRAGDVSVYGAGSHEAVVAAYVAMRTGMEDEA